MAAVESQFVVHEAGHVHLVPGHAVEEEVITEQTRRPASRQASPGELSAPCDLPEPETPPGRQAVIPELRLAGGIPSARSQTRPSEPRTVVRALLLSLLK